jgi:hypothetical protein
VLCSPCYEVTAVGRCLTSTTIPANHLKLSQPARSLCDMTSKACVNVLLLPFYHKRVLHKSYSINHIVVR